MTPFAIEALANGLDGGGVREPGGKRGRVGKGLLAEIPSILKLKIAPLNQTAFAFVEPRR